MGPKKIGLIGGLTFRAGIFYYDQIPQRYTSENRECKLVLSHADVSISLTCVDAGDKAGLGNYLGSIANELFDAGAQLVAVTAIAPHLVMNEIASVARGSVVNVLESIPAALMAAGINRIGVFGNSAVMETNVFGSVPGQMLVKLKSSVLDDVHRMYTDIALHGKRGNQPEMLFLEDAARDVIDNGSAQAILLAGTDLSSF